MQRALAHAAGEDCKADDGVRREGGDESEGIEAGEAGDKCEAGEKSEAGESSVACGQWSVIRDQQRGLRGRVRLVAASGVRPRLFISKPILIAA